VPIVVVCFGILCGVRRASPLWVFLLDFGGHKSGLAHDGVKGKTQRETQSGEGIAALQTKTQIGQQQPQRV
jgi:hypothetical protein